MGLRRQCIVGRCKYLRFASRKTLLTAVEEMMAIWEYKTIFTSADRIPQMCVSFVVPRRRLEDKFQMVVRVMQKVLIHRKRFVK